jgi:hypothetical protein
MKTNFFPHLIAVVAVGIFAFPSAHAQNGGTGTTQPAARPGDTPTHQVMAAHGTISSRTPDAIVTTGDNGAAPVTYAFTKSTEYVDEDGRPVSVEVIRTGVPVSVQYVREGDRLLASRVIVYAPSEATPGTKPSVALHKTSVTTEAPDGSITTKTSEHGDITSHAIYSHGIMTSRTPDSFVVKSERDTVPVTYSYSKTTVYVNDAGQPVSFEEVNSGVPVTVEYERDGDHLRASRVIVHQRPAPAAAQKPFAPEGSAPTPPPQR